MDARGGEGGAFHVAALVIEEDVRAQHLQDGTLVDASEEGASLSTPSVHIPFGEINRE